VQRYTRPATPAETASMMEFVLEALHQHSLLGKDLLDQETRYSDIMGSMLSSLGRDDDEEDEDDEFFRRYR